MAFIVKKKRYKFNVDFQLDELSSVPFVSGILFAKIRLLDGGSFTEISSREEIKDHCVKWNARFSFSCKMAANVNTGVLETCVCRVSVRRELKGGKSFQKLGFADVNLSEFAGSGLTTRRYLLEGYDSKHRQDNSMLKVSLDMSLSSGDPCFKVPDSQKLDFIGADLNDLNDDNKGGEGGEDNSESSVASGSSGFGSLPRKERHNDSDEPSPPQQDDHQGAVEFEPAHSRNSSHSSQHSKCSGPSIGSGQYERSLERRRKLDGESKKQKTRVESTRVDTDELIDELINESDFIMNDSAETSGLQLFIGKDGSAALGGREIQSKMSAGSFKQVVFDEA